MKTNINTGENFNIINYLKIVDLSLLNIFDYLDYREDSSELVIVNDKLSLNLNPTTKRLLEGFIINNINDVIYYGKTNILVNSCEPYNNWRNSLEIINSKYEGKCLISDESLFIDELKLNMFLNELFEKLPNINNKLNLNKSTDIVISSKASLKFLNFKNVDVYDSFSILENILANFGNITIDDFKYNIICDGNNKFSHGSSINYDSSIIDLIKIQLIEQGIL